MYFQEFLCFSTTADYIKTSYEDVKHDIQYHYSGNVRLGKGCRDTMSFVWFVQVFLKT